MKILLRLTFLCVILVAAVSGCNQTGGVSTYTLSGSVAQPTGVTVPIGTHVYLKLVVNGGASSSAALYWTRTAFSSGSATYSVGRIIAGTYTGWAFIDMNGDAPDNSSAMPDAGDWGTTSGAQITISGDQTQDLSPDGWTRD